MADALDTPTWIRGLLRSPKQMLAEQEYGGHLSIHDDSTAEEMGFQAGGPIEGPTHFSQFVPLLHDLWGQEWFETGCLSAHYRNMVVEGEQVRALVEQPGNDQTQVRIRAEKEDGTEVLIGTASIRGDVESSEIATRIARLRPPGPLVVLRDLRVGMKGKGLEEVRMDFDQHMGALYPFSLNQKLDRITESSPWYTADEGDSSPWGRPIIPLEMVSVLGGYSNRQAGFPTRGPALGLFAGQQIRMIDGPLFVGQDYLLEREIVALSESRRTESNWVRTTFLDADSKEPKAEMILNNATLKHSFEGYEEERATYEAERAANA